MGILQVRIPITIGILMLKTAEASLRKESVLLQDFITSPLFCIYKLARLRNVRVPLFVYKKYNDVELQPRMVFNLQLWMFLRKISTFSCTQSTGKQSQKAAAYEFE